MYLPFIVSIIYQVVLGPYLLVPGPYLLGQQEDLLMMLMGLRGTLFVKDGGSTMRGINMVEMRE